MKAIPRILVAVDFGEASRLTLECAALLRAHCEALVDAYYIWPPLLRARDDPKDGMLRELEAFSHRDGAWDVFAYLGDLDRRGVLRIRGYLTPCPAGRSLLSLAHARGYDLVIETTGWPGGQAFEMHGDPIAPVASSEPIPRRKG